MQLPPFQRWRRCSRRRSTLEDSSYAYRKGFSRAGGARYADDFVVLARNVAEARRAQEAAREVLAGLGLQLNREDTALRSIDMGFSYPGYLFVRSLVLEQPAKEPTSPSKLLMPEDRRLSPILALSWFSTRSARSTS